MSRILITDAVVGIEQEIFADALMKRGLYLTNEASGTYFNITCESSDLR